jgi:ribosomal protein S18 acetylase RimI-like enzyme
MLRELARRARAQGYRVIVCETQTTNAPAIAFYRHAGFHLEGVDLSYYTNEDVNRGEVAIFMKKRIRTREPRARRDTQRQGHDSR